MPTFQDAYTALMGIVNRPASETDVLTQAKLEINNAIAYLQRDHAYRYTERLTEIPFAANTLMVNLDGVCDGKLRDIQSFQLLATTGAEKGNFLEYKSYNQIQAARRKFQREHPNGNSGDEWNYIMSEVSHENYTNRIHTYYVFRMGDNLGLYPTPSSDQFVLMNAHIWLPFFEDDADENFFLTYAFDIVLTIAAKRMAMFMKEDNRYNVSQQEMAVLLEGLKAWDSQLHESPFSTIQ